MVSVIYHHFPPGIESQEDAPHVNTREAFRLVSGVNLRLRKPQVGTPIPILVVREDERKVEGCS